MSSVKNQRQNRCRYTTAGHEAWGSKDPATASPANGVWVHYQCHRYIEENREHALKLGYLVYQHKDPREVPLILPQVSVYGVMLDDEGEYEPLQEPCAAARNQP